MCFRGGLASLIISCTGYYLKDVLNTSRQPCILIPRWFLKMPLAMLYPLGFCGIFSARVIWSPAEDLTAGRELSRMRTQASTDVWVLTEDYCNPWHTRNFSYLLHSSNSSCINHLNLIGRILLLKIFQLSFHWENFSPEFSHACEGLMCFGRAGWVGKVAYWSCLWPSSLLHEFSGVYHGKLMVDVMPR